MFIRLNKRAQTTAEYAILIALVVGAVIAMQVYVRRSIQSKIKQAADFQDTANLSNFSFRFNNTSTQYEPYYFNSTATTGQYQSLRENMTTGGGVTRGTNSTSTVVRNQTISQ